jgi:hypothetical protein
VSVVVGHTLSEGHRAGGLAEQRTAFATRERVDDPLLQLFGNNLAAGGPVVRLGKPVGLVVLDDFAPVEQTSEHRGMRNAAQLDCLGQMLRSVVHTRDQGTPVKGRGRSLG